MLLPAKCPECGGLIEVNSEVKAANCKFCGSAFIVEEAVNNFNTYFNVTNIYNTSHNYGDGAVVNVYDDKFKDFVIEGGVLKKYQGESIDVVIPDGVVEIGRMCFESLKIKSVVIPDSVTSIGVSAFYKCTNLESVTIPNSVTSIGERAFFDCANLSSIKIPNGIVSLEQDIFWGCISLTSITIPDSVTSIGDCAFSGCTNLSLIAIPESVTSIGNNAFQKCTSLASIIIPNSVKNIGSNVFVGCTSIKKINCSAILLKNRGAFIDYWLQNGLCQYCGGEFKNGLFTVKCSKCNHYKDY